MSQSVKTRSSVEATLVRKAWADPEFKAGLLADPTSAYTAELKKAGATVPAGIEIQALPEDSKTLYLVIPRLDIDPDTEVKLHERSTRADFEAALILSALRDPDFKRQLVADPKALYEAQLASIHKDAKLPADLVIRVVEESDNVVYFRLPQQLPQGGELSEEELAEAAGGVASVSVAIAAVITAGGSLSVVLLLADEEVSRPVE